MKDLFGWVWSLNAEDSRIGSTVDQLLSAKRASDTLVVSEAKQHLISIAREQQQPWLEVFARHWDLQHRLCDINEGQTAIRDAVEAFEIAHRPENEGCPQSICAAQDLCIAYTRTDGPGFAPDVIEACRSTLERIDPSWPCYDCVSAEQRDGLFHLGRFDDVLALIDTVEHDIRGQGGLPSLSYEEARLETLLALDRVGDAVRIVETVDPSHYERHTELSETDYRIQVARVQVSAGQLDAALETYGALPDIVEHPTCARKTLLLVDELIAAGALVDSEHVAYQRVVSAVSLFERGAFRDAFEIAVTASLAASRRGAVSSAQRAIDLAMKIAPELNLPLDAPHRLAEATAALAVAPDEVAQGFGTDAEVESLTAVEAAEGLDEAGFLRLAACLRALGWSGASGELMRRRTEAKPDDVQSGLAYFFWLLDESRLDLAAPEARRIATHDPAFGAWCSAHLAVRRGEWSAAAEHCAEVVRLDTSAVNCRRLWGSVERQLGDFATAARLAGEVLDLADEPDHGDYWAAIVAGTLARDWPLVRRGCSGLDIPLDTAEGPIDEEWEGCEVTFIEDDGSEATLEALRTGPATARVVTVVRHGWPQRHGDEVVFEPIPLDPTPDDPSAATGPARYAALATTRSAGFSAYNVFGLVDEVARWEELRTGMYAAGFPIWSFGGGGINDRKGGTIHSVFATAAHGPESTSERLHEALDSLTAHWTMPIYWSELVAEVDGDTAEHDRRQTRMGAILDALFDDDNAIESAGDEE